MFALSTDCDFFLFNALNQKASDFSLSMHASSILYASDETSSEMCQSLRKHKDWTQIELENDQLF